MTLSFREWRRLRRRALAAQQKDQSEVCGMLALDGNRLVLEFMENLAGPCEWSLATSAIKETEQRMFAAGLRVIGTFHSHPISEPSPGTRDIEAMELGEGYQLIYDVCGTEARLWHKDGRGSPVEKPITLHRMPNKTEEPTGASG